jgi:hypothetical protein
MSLEELALRQQITEAVVVASLDLDSVVDDIDNEHAQIVELQNIVLARRQRAIGTTHLATLAYGPDTQSETGFRKAPRPIADKTALICGNYKGDSRGVTNWSLLAGMERWRTCA